jgi:hypothetical protein
MKFKSTTVAGTVEILAADEFTAIPITVAGTSVVKAGTPLTAAGAKATSASGAIDAAGILLYDVDPTENPNGALVVAGVIDKAKAEKHSGVSITAAELKAAVPGIVLRDNIGTN